MSTAPETGIPQPARRRQDRRGADRRRADRRGRPTLDGGRAWTVALGVGGGLLLADLVGATVTRLRNLLILLLISVFLSFAMEPAVQWLHRRGLRRGVGTLLVFVATAVVGVAFAVAMATLVGRQLSNLITGFPDLLDDLATRAAALPEPFADQAAAALEEQAAALPDRLDDVAQTLGRGAIGLGTTLLGGVLNTLTILLVTFYLVADGPRLRRTLSGRLQPDSQRELLEVWELAIAKTGGYVYSRLLTAAASAVVHVIAFTLIDLPNAAVLGLWVGLVSSLIPVVGTYLAGALPLIVALATDPVQAIWVLLVIAAYQQIENYLVAPRITEATLELHPALAFLAVLVGAALLGPAGALLALPVAAIVAALVSTYGERHEVLAHGLTRDAPPRARDVEWLPPTDRADRGATAPDDPQAAGSTTTNVEP